VILANHMPVEFFSQDETGFDKEGKRKEDKREFVFYF